MLKFLQKLLSSKKICFTSDVSVWWARSSPWAESFPSLTYEYDLAKNYINLDKHFLLILN